MLIQPAGRTWDYFHEVLLHWGGAVVILGTIVLLGAAYLIMGRIRISAGRSGQTCVRFKAFERFSHWLTAVSFVILALTGLNITFGKIVLLPLIGPEAFSDISQIAKYVHNFTSFSFVAGLVLIIVIFFRDNLPRRSTSNGSSRAAASSSRSMRRPAASMPARRWSIGFRLAAGVAVSVSGFLLLFPFYGTNIAEMQLAQVVHAVVAVLFIALILASHLYRHARNGGRVRGDGHRRSRSQLGEGTPRPLACRNSSPNNRRSSADRLRQYQRSEHSSGRPNGPYLYRFRRRIWR